MDPNLVTPTLQPIIGGAGSLGVRGPHGTWDVNGMPVAARRPLSSDDSSGGLFLGWPERRTLVAPTFIPPIMPDQPPGGPSAERSSLPSRIRGVISIPWFLAPSARLVCGSTPGGLSAERSSHPSRIRGINNHSLI